MTNDKTKLKCSRCGKTYEGELPFILLRMVGYCPECYCHELPALNEILGFIEWLKSGDRWPGLMHYSNGAVPCVSHAVTWNIREYNQGVTCPAILCFVDGKQMCLMCLRKKEPETFEKLQLALEKAQPAVQKRVIAEHKGKPETVQDMLQKNPKTAHCRVNK